ncbi:MAG TPA: PspA/IM30 family protein [Kofleriaceae bacterium]|nr:PspA/IM30 family protein [Kofleriaceae bacterium]
MSFISRIRRGIKAKANAAVDKMTDPERELDMTIMELEEQHKSALKELVGYKATAKQMEQELEKYRTRVTTWEKRAMDAVKAGDDELARSALKEKKLAEAEIVKITRDRDEATGYAIELNRSRKTAETKLRILKLKKGTMAQQLAQARSGNTSAFGHDDEVWDRFERAEDRIEAEAIQSEVDAAMAGEEADGSPIRISDGLGSAQLGAGDPDDPLSALKQKMAAHAAQKKLKE